MQLPELFYVVVHVYIAPNMLSSSYKHVIIYSSLELTPGTIDEWNNNNKVYTYSATKGLFSVSTITSMFSALLSALV